MSIHENRRSYAISFISFLLRSSDVKNMNRIILYGSVAKNQSTEESDIDIFIDVKKDTKKMKNDIKLLVENFYKSREAIIFKLLGIENDINVKTGKLDEWGDLKRSIQSDGIILWSKFESGKPQKTLHMVIFYWKKIEKNRGAFLNKIYGYKTDGKAYTGMIERWEGKKLGKSCILIPIRYRDEMMELIKKYKIYAKSLEIFI